MAKKSTKVLHLSKDSRSRLISLRDEVMWLLDEDAKFGFDEKNISYRLGPYLMRVLFLIWCKPLKTVSRSFRPVDSSDSARAFIREDIYEGMNNRLISLDAENMRLREKLGLKRDDDLPF